MAVVVERTLIVAAAPPVAMGYLEDFSNAEEWDPGTVRCTRRDTGPVEVGSSWDNTSKFAGSTIELLYRLDSRTEQQLVFVGENARATSRDVITVTPAAAGSSVHYRAELDLHGILRFVAPVVGLLFERVADRTRDQLQAVLDRLAVPRSPG